MKTPFTPSFHLANPSLTRVSRRPFTPTYPLPFIDDEATEYHMCSTCQLSYRWYDAFDVFVAVLEAVASRPMDIPIASHLPDLHLVYQLHGTSTIETKPTGSQKDSTTLQLRESHRTEVYSAQAKAVLHIQPDAATKRYALAAVVPKGAWVLRHPHQDTSPMETLIQLLKQRYVQHRYLNPTPITPNMQAWLHLLFTTPRHTGMALDDALNGPMVKLVDAHRRDYLRTLSEKQERELIDAARILAEQLVQRMDGGAVPTTADIAAALYTTARRLRELHKHHHEQRFIHYIHACRMEEAKKRLHSGLPVLAVAYQLGWSEPTNFTAQFRKHTGFTPTEFLQLPPDGRP